MKINIFEGTRRVTKLIAVIWFLGMSFYAFTDKGYVHGYFRVDSPNSVPIRMSEQEDCDEDDAKEYLSSQYTSKGSEISVTLCFKSRIFNDRRKLIPLSEMSYPEVDDIAQWRTERAAKAEDKKVAANFKLSKTDEEWADSAAWSARWKNIKNNITITIGGLAFLWIFSWCVGWIVRGFRHPFWSRL